MEKRCSFPDGMSIWLDAAGGVKLDACLYEEVETVKHCTVHILRCVRCGHEETEREKEKSENDLISRKKLLEFISERYCEPCIKEGNHHLTLCGSCRLDDAISLIEEFPTEEEGEHL